MVNASRKKKKMDTLLEEIYEVVRSELKEKPWTQEKWKKENLNPYWVAYKWLYKFDKENNITERAFGKGKSRRGEAIYEKLEMVTAGYSIELYLKFKTMSIEVTNGDITRDTESLLRYTNPERAEDVLDIEEYAFNNYPIFKLDAQVNQNIEIEYLVLEDRTILILNNILNDGYNKVVSEITRKEEKPWCPKEIEDMINNLMYMAGNYERQMDELSN